MFLDVNKFSKRLEAQHERLISAEMGDILT
jgi:hypothetical protein